MKRLLISAIILVFISVQANGQQTQDTLYLKNGYKAVGKLLWQSKTECRFRSSDGILFTFLPDEVERVVTTPEMIMRKVNPDTLNIDQLNIYMDKAVNMRNAGRALTLSGAGVAATGIVLGIIFLNIPGEPGGDMDGLLAAGLFTGIGSLVGISCAAVGIPLWAVGGSRKTKAELSLQKLNVAPENSMGVGLGIAITF
jgi:hypothetical protein